MFGLVAIGIPVPPCASAFVSTGSPDNLCDLRLVRELCVSDILPRASLFVSDSPTAS